MKKISFYLSFLLIMSFTQNIKAQLIENGNFELGTIASPPNQVNANIVYADGWSDGCEAWNNGPSTADLFDCNSTAAFNKIPAYNEIGPLNSNSCRFAGIADERESIKGTITEPLSELYEYTVSFIGTKLYFQHDDNDSRYQVVLRNNANCSLEKLVYTSTPLTVYNYEGGGVTNNWQSFSGTFTLDALDIANNYNQLEIRIENDGELSFYRFLIDDVELKKEKIDFSCPEDLEIVMNCETGKLEVQNIPNNITINTMFWDYDFQTFPNSNSTTFQPTQEGLYSFGIIFTFPNGEECHHFIHYEYVEDVCCEVTGSQAVASLQNVNNYYNIPNTPYGSMEVPAMCDRVVLDGSLSTCEDSYFISVSIFDPVSWNGDPIYEGWTQGQAPSDIDLTQPPFNLVFTNQTFYMIQFAVGPDWDAEYILFWYDCDTKREMVIAPNPTQGEFTIAMTDNDEEGTLEVSDISGNIAYRGKVSGEMPTRVNISRATPGVYFVKVNIKGEVYTERVIKIK